MPAKNSFSSAAFTLSVMSILTSSSILGGLAFGCLALIFAELSKKGQLKLDSRAKIAFCFSIIGIILTILMTASFIYSYTHDFTYKKSIDDVFVQVYGMPLDQYIKSVFDVFTGK